MRKFLLSLILALALAGCDELAGIQSDACGLIVEGCAISVVQSYEYCAQAIDAPGATADELRDLCDAYFRGQMCQCLTSVCVRDVVFYAPYEYEPWARSFVSDLNCPSEILDPYQVERD